MKISCIDFHILLLATLLLVLPLKSARVHANTGPSIDDHLQFREANQLLVEQNQPAEALARYLELEQSRGISANLAHNIATCYLRLEQPGMARLYLERSLWMDPHHPEARNNLRILLNRIGVEAPQASSLQSALTILSSNQWFYTGCCLLIFAALVTCIQHTLRSLQRVSMRTITRSLPLKLVAVAAGCGSISVAYLQSKDSEYLIITEAEAAILQAPFDLAAPVATIPEAHKLRFHRTHETFYFVEAPEANLRGWVSRKAATPIVP
jgi:tetratricopeptide (TPR) repeat protein